MLPGILQKFIFIMIVVTINHGQILLRWNWLRIKMEEKFSVIRFPKDLNPGGLFSGIMMVRNSEAKRVPVTKPVSR